jgi:hypothetical protein
MAKKKQQPIEPEEESEDIEFDDFDNDVWIQLASATD